MKNLNRSTITNNRKSKFFIIYIILAAIFLVSISVMLFFYENVITGTLRNFIILSIGILLGTAIPAVGILISNSTNSNKEEQDQSILEEENQYEIQLLQNLKKINDTIEHIGSKLIDNSESKLNEVRYEQQTSEHLLELEKQITLLKEDNRKFKHTISKFEEKFAIVTESTQNMYQTNSNRAEHVKDTDPNLNKNTLNPKPSIQNSDEILQIIKEYNDAWKENRFNSWDSFLSTYKTSNLTLANYEERKAKFRNQPLFREDNYQNSMYIVIHHKHNNYLFPHPSAKTSPIISTPYSSDRLTWFNSIYKIIGKNIAAHAVEVLKPAVINKAMNRITSEGQIIMPGKG